jgi:magnesium transporter
MFRQQERDTARTMANFSNSNESSIAFCYICCNQSKMANKKQALNKRKLKQPGRQVGLPPGALKKQVGSFSDNTLLSLFLFHESEVLEKDIHSVSELKEYLPKENQILWLNIEGLHNVEVLKEIGELFHLHNLLLEDILNTDQLPKMDDYGEYVSLCLRMVKEYTPNEKVQDEQITMVLMPQILLSFQEKPGDVFMEVRERIRTSGGRIRQRGADYLLYALTDLVVDHYFQYIEKLGESVEELEENVFQHANANHMNDIHELKRELLYFRRYAFPLREAISRIQRNPNPIISSDTQRYFTDVYDHIFHILDLLESYRELTTGIKDMYLSTVSFQMNKVIQMLTIISTIFIPLTFLVGVYGMNFKEMPELEWEYGYYLVWGIMGVITLAMVYFFKRKKWF